jgi:hypothetical protein
MTDGSSSKIVQKYRPKGLAADAQVSVSGLDVSKDKRELLVSYENDQVCLCNLRWSLCTRMFCGAHAFNLHVDRSLHFQFFQTPQLLAQP